MCRINLLYTRRIFFLFFKAKFDFLQKNNGLKYII